MDANKFKIRKRKSEIAKKKFSKQIREQRKRLCMSLEEMGKILGREPASIHQWETGKNLPHCGVNIILQSINKLKPLKNGQYFKRGNPGIDPKLKLKHQKLREAFKKKRLQLNLSKVDVERILGLGRSVVWNWEAGKSNPKDTWEKVLETLSKKGR